MAPHADQEKSRDQRHFVKGEEIKQIDGKKGPESTEAD